MKIYFTSDNHFGHTNVIKYTLRPFSNIDEMNSELIARYNSVVNEDDLVYHLGDFSLDERLVPIILPKLNGRKQLIAGNHDKCHSCHKKHLKYIQKYIEYGFESVKEVDTLNNWLLCHMPYINDDLESERYAQYRPIDKGMWLLHGHVHNSWKVKGRMINVGVDQWDYAPVSLEQLEELRKI